MCLAVPARVIERKNGMALVELQGVKRRASLRMVPEARVGDWILLHAGYAIEVLDEAAARETLEFLSQAFGEGNEKGVQEQ
ncbi:MAG: HypC/HybG/HupF family hydrogenase formation chaperone [Candidatus Hydrogenedentota bacterium]|nr:MAG: HypC/HybG/HupF family hydrogenase formation chaperone [Candidatus Hydrogenedentota bacterium]